MPSSDTAAAPSTVISVKREELPLVEHRLVKAGYLCDGADTRIGYCSSPTGMEPSMCCAEMCWWVPLCKYFSYNVETKQCWWEHTGSEECEEGWEEATPEVSMYALDARYTDFSWKLVRQWAECASPNAKLGSGLASTVEECASECFADADCNFFVYGNPMSMTNQMRCYREFIAEDDCDEGWEFGSFDFYALYRKNGPPPEPPDHWACNGPPPTGSSGGALAFGAHAGHHTCFEYHRGTTSWEKAEHDCFRKGMHLASIHTAEENELVLNLCDKACWIGYTDAEKEGHWLWTDGSPSEGEHPWNEGVSGRPVLPDDATDGSFMYPRGNGWVSPGSWDDDVVNGTERPYVCRRDFRKTRALPTMRKIEVGGGGFFAFLFHLLLGGGLALCCLRAYPRYLGRYGRRSASVRIPDEDVSIALSPSRKGLGAGGGAALAAVEPTDISGFGTGSTVEAGPML